jgi:hypothetical protein
MSSSGLTWVKSTYSGQGNCVEVAGHGSRVLVRDTQDRSGPVLRISPAAWRRFAGRMKRSLASGPGRRVGTTRSVPWARTELQRAGQLVVSRTAAVSDFVGEPGEPGKRGRERPAERCLLAVGVLPQAVRECLRCDPPFRGDFEPAGSERLALGLIEVRCYDDCLNGAAPPGLGEAGAEQTDAGRRPSGGRGDHEVVDLAGEAAGVVDRRCGVEGGDEEPGELAGLFADQGDDLVAGDKAAQVGAVPVGCGGCGPPEQWLVAGVLVAADACQGGHRGDISLHRGAYLLTHPPSVAALPASGASSLVMASADAGLVAAPPA